jgi:hypothetical protein
MDASPTGSQDICLIEIADVERRFRTRIGKGERVFEDAPVRLLETDDVGVDHGFEELKKAAGSEAVFDAAIRVADDQQLETCLLDPSESLGHPWEHV